MLAARASLGSARSPWQFFLGVSLRDYTDRCLAAQQCWEQTPRGSKARTRTSVPKAEVITARLTTGEPTVE